MGRYLAKKKGFILVSHDRAFLDASVDHILAIDKTKITVTHGNFSVWYENKQRQDQFKLNENAKLTRDIQRIKTAASQAKTWADKAESVKIGKKAALKQERTGKVGTRAYIGEKSRRMQQRRNEPLNYIDIYTRMQIGKVITEVRPTMILVEHDEIFAKTIAAKVVKVV